MLGVAVDNALSRSRGFKDDRLSRRYFGLSRWICCHHGTLISAQGHSMPSTGPLDHWTEERDTPPLVQLSGLYERTELPAE
jgi:hypothetical protein